MVLKRKELFEKTRHVKKEATSLRNTFYEDRGMQNTTKEFCLKK